MRSVLILSGLLALGACATATDDGLLASTPIVRELGREQSDLVEVARFSRLKEGGELPEGWRTWGMNSGKRPTEYRLVASARGTVLEAHAVRSATGLHRYIRVEPQRQSVLEWSWRVDSLIPGADKRYAQRDDSAARLVISFHGDAEKLDFEQRAKLRLVKAITGDALPYAMLMYVWANEVPVETVLPNPHFDRIRIIVVESGGAHLGQWLQYRRNVLQDFRRAFGEEPGDIVSIGVLTDSDNTQHVAHGYYGDITLGAP